MKPALRLSDIPRCFQGVTPSLMATCDARGVPNITYLSHVYYLDDGHVALSCQFFNKTRRNLDENPLACVELYDPLTLQAYRLRLKFLRSEKTGPLFDAMSARIEAIASATGMKGIFRLIAADVFEVLSLQRLEGYLASSLSSTDADAPSLEGYRSEVRGLQWVSERINRSSDLESLLGVALEALDEFFQFSHTSVLLYDEACDKLITLASRGYEATGIGAEVPVGVGIIGTAARDRQVLRFSMLDSALGYGRAIRREMSGADRRDEVALPGLPNARSVLVIPLTVGRRLVGVLSAEDPDPMRFGDWHEAYLQIIGNQIALGIDRMIDRAEDAEGETGATGATGAGGATGARAAGASGATGAAGLSAIAPGAKADVRRVGGQRGAPQAASPKKKRTLVYYRKDEAIFVDGEYLIRNIPARILWKLLDESQRTGRTEFTNREVRLDESLGLPPVKDNFESRLILLRHRLQEKCPDLQIVATGRGRFALQTAAAIEMIER